MEDRGCLVAVDPKEKRLRGLMANVFRLGHTNVLVVAADGRELPGGAAFDRVLVDAPCSAEGNFRRTGGRLPKRDGKFVRYVTALQEALLRRAIELVRPGGTVVYSTCTWAPEENEAVVARVLADMPVALEPIPLELPHAPGIEAWNGREYAAELRHAWRLYPQHLDSGGAFVARLRKAEGSGEGNWGREGREGGEGGEAWGPVPEAFPGEDPSAARERIEVATALLRDRFGVDPDALAALGWMARGDNLWAETAGEWPVEGWRAHGGWRVVSHGLRAFRQAGPGARAPVHELPRALRRRAPFRGGGAERCRAGSPPRRGAGRGVRREGRGPGAGGRALGGPGPGPRHGEPGRTPRPAGAEGAGEEAPGAPGLDGTSGTPAD
jgi:hypothetical protein